MINHIQNKSFCLHNICVGTVYIYYVYINTHTCMCVYIRKLCCVYILNIFIYNIKDNDINILTCKYLKKIYCMCVKNQMDFIGSYIMQCLDQSERAVEDAVVMVTCCSLPQALITLVWQRCSGSWRSITPKTPTTSSWSDSHRSAAVNTVSCDLFVLVLMYTYSSLLHVLLSSGRFLCSLTSAAVVLTVNELLMSAVIWEQINMHLTLNTIKWIDFVELIKQ